MKVLIYRNILLNSLNTWMVSKLPNSISTGLLDFSVSPRKYSFGSTLSDVKASSKKVLNSSGKSKSSDIVRLFFYANLRENCVFIRQKWRHRFPKFFTIVRVKYSLTPKKLLQKVSQLILLGFKVHYNILKVYQSRTPG